MNGAKAKCLVIMPFGTSPDEQLASRLVYDHIIAPALKIADVSGTRIDSERLLQTPISTGIEKHLQTAPVLLADLSGNNPNVLFELGYRKAQGKPFVCISNKPEAAAFWAKIFQIIDYTPADAVKKIADALRSAVADFGVRANCEDELAELAEMVRRKEKFINPFQDRVAAWRIRRAWDQVETIQKRTWEFEAKSPTAYVAYIFEGIMQLLEPGEEYSTVTNLNFWSSKAVGDSAFLKANIQAAKRGVTVKRVFLVDKKGKEHQTNSRYLEAVMREHKRACDEANKSSPGRMVVRYLLSDNLNRDLARYGHFGLARHMTADGTDSGGVVIFPHYAAPIEGGEISRLTLIFSKGRTSDDTKALEYVNKFDRAFAASQPLNAFLRRK